MREAVRPYITEEVYYPLKFSFIAPPARAINTPHGLYMSKRLNYEAITVLSWLHWDFVGRMKEDFFSNNNRRAQNILNFILSLVVISEKFSVKPYTAK